MQYKNYNAYRITHKDGSIEDINAVNLIQALENMNTQETESKVVQAFLVKENVRTLVEDEPTEIIFSAVVADGGTGSIATPASGKIHVGDQIQFKAIPARNYAFDCWKLNGVEISKDADLLFTMSVLPENVDTAVFTAVFKEADIDWTSKVEPVEASGAGCVAFPASGTIKANGDLSLIAVEGDGYVFDHWERNGEEAGTNKILKVEATPLAVNETTCVYKAVFRTK